MTDDETRQPEMVIKCAQAPEGEWAIWHPGDGTQYRVKIIKQLGGPNHGDGVLLVSITDDLVAVPFNQPTPGYRFKPWSAARWRREGLNPSAGYDWWPKVIEPLMRELGAKLG